MESKSSRSRVEKYPLPGTVKGITSLVEEIMLEGSVERIELDVALPVRVVRQVPTGDPISEEFDVGLKGTLRQADFIEYYSEGATPYQVVVDMMQLLHKESRYPVCWVTGISEQEPSTLDLWLEWQERGMPSGTEYLLGLPVKTVDDLPDSVLILCGSEFPNAEQEEITMAIKAAIEFRSGDERESIVGEVHDDSVRAGSRECGPTASQLALAAGGLRRVDWNPTGESGEGVG